MSFVSRARIAGILAICLLMLGAPGALAGDTYSYQPDAQIRLGSGSYVGENIFNTTAVGQRVFNSGVIGQKLTFFVFIENEGSSPDSFKVKRSAGFNAGYRVRYYDAANNDVTGRVNTGTFTTPVLQPFGVGEYVMRATVKIRSLATLCSVTSRLITVSSVAVPTSIDAVRFTAALATPEQNCPPVAVDETASITENSTSVSGNLLANDIDPDGDLLNIGVALQIGVVHGTLSPIVAGGYTWFLNNAGPVDALNNGDTLTQVIQYSISDGNGGSDFGMLTITIHGVTDPD